MSMTLAVVSVTLCIFGVVVALNSALLSCRTCISLFPHETGNRYCSGALRESYGARIQAFARRLAFLLRDAQAVGRCG